MIPIREYEKIVAQARDAERARCLKVLEDLRDSSQHSGAEWIAYRFAITALSEAATSPVASSPVGGEQ